MSEENNESGSTETTETFTEAAENENNATTNSTVSETRPNTATASTLDGPAPEPKEGEEDYSWVNAKFMKDGKPDFKQMADSYKNLEGALRNKGVPVVPETVDEYQYDWAEGMDIDDDKSLAFRELSKELGLTVDQYKGIMDAYEANYIDGLPDAELTGSTLKETWGKDFDANVNAANEAISAYLPEGEDITKYPHLANDPIFAQIMAKVGAELGEDSAPVTKGRAPSAGMSKIEIQEMMGSGDYWTNREKQKIVSDWYEHNS